MHKCLVALLYISPQNYQSFLMKAAERCGGLQEFPWNTGQRCQAHSPPPRLLHSSVSSPSLRPCWTLSLTFHFCTLSFSDFLLPWITVGAKLKVCVCFVHAFALDALLWCHVACGGLLLYNKHWTMKSISSSMRSYKSESSSSVICLSDFLPALQHTQTAKRHLRMTRS